MNEIEKAASTQNVPSPVAYATRKGGTSRIDRRRARTERSIFAALESLSSYLPLDELSVARIAEAADINRVTFYAHFRNLDDLLDAALKAAFDEAAASMADSFIDETALEAVGENVRAYAAAILRHRAFLRWVYDSSSRDRLAALLGEGFRSALERRIGAVVSTCSARRRGLFAQYTSGGLASLVLGFLAGESAPSDVDELADFLPKAWLPSAYMVLGIGDRGGT
jgi:AcrR family transcriptional regulator